jgi:multicomponent Na+:H+ antiporter subunit B
MMSSNPVFRIATKIMFAPIIVYGLYVQFHGDYGPGGGFQAGVIIAAAFVLYSIVFGLAAVKKLAPPKIIDALMAMGVLIYAGVGVFTILRGGNYLDYYFINLYDPVHGQHLGILLVELGVGVTVTSVMLRLFYAFAGYGTAKGGTAKGDQ